MERINQFSTMLKHCSQSCVDVSRRSLRHNSFTLDSRLGGSAEMLDEMSSLDEEREYRSYCASNTNSFSGLVTLPRNRTKPVSESCMSLPNFSSVSAIKVYAQCLRPHLAYKTVIITRHTTSRQVVLGLLSRFRMKHRDPRLFYLTMEVNIGEEKSRTISLEDSSCIADLITCNPWGTSRFRLKARQGGLVKIYDGEVRADSVYKSIIVSQVTTVKDTINILENCYASKPGTELKLHEFDPQTGATRLLLGSEKPLEVQDEWGKDTSKVFQLKRTEEVKYPCDPVIQPMFSRSLVRNSILRQSIRKKQFFKSMISDRLDLDLDGKNLFSLSRFSLSDQIISESVEDSEEGGSSDLENQSEGDLNCSTSGVSSLSCSSLDSLEQRNINSFFT